MSRHQDANDGATVEIIDPTTGEIFGPEEAAEQVAQRVKGLPLGREIEEGIVAQTVITMRDFLPGKTKDWANKQMAGQPSGQRILLGKLYGACRKVHREKTLYEGKELESWWLEGGFEAIVEASGEVIRAPNLIVPRAYGELMEHAFEQGAEVGDIDCKVGIESTGKMILYRWVLLSHVDLAAFDRLNAIKARALKREARQAIEHEQRKQITSDPATAD